MIAGYDVLISYRRRIAYALLETGFNNSRPGSLIEINPDSEHSTRF